MARSAFTQLEKYPPSDQRAGGQKSSLNSSVLVIHPTTAAAGAGNAGGVPGLGQLRKAAGMDE